MMIFCKKDQRPIISLDFDGVIHSFDSGWQGATVIPDSAVPGALDFIRVVLESRKYRLAIFSSRNFGFGGKGAMKTWLATVGLERKYVEALEFPRLKPPAMLFIDDRCMQFNGRFPTLDQIADFSPWYKVGGLPRQVCFICREAEMADPRVLAEYKKETGSGRHVMFAATGVKWPESIAPVINHSEKLKVAGADDIYVMNIGGDTTKSMADLIENAELLGKPVRWLEPRR